MKSKFFLLIYALFFTNNILPAAAATDQKSSVIYGNPFTSKELTNEERFKYILVTPKMLAGTQLNPDINPAFLKGDYTFDLSDQKQMIDDGIAILDSIFFHLKHNTQIFLMLDYQKCFDKNGLRKIDTNPTVIGITEFGISKKPDVVIIHHFAINKFFKKQGSGRMFFSQFEIFIKMIKKDDCITITLDSVDDAEAFWNKMGFKNILGSIMQKKITP